MGQSVEFITHKGKTIICVDYAYVRGEEFLRRIEEHERESLKITGEESLHLLNFTGCRMDSAAQKRADQLVETLVEKGYQVKTACFGFSGIQKIIAAAVKRDIYFANTPEEAKDWLTC
jgi:hypothetical protein